MDNRFLKLKKNLLILLKKFSLTMPASALSFYLAKSNLIQECCCWSVGVMTDATVPFRPQTPISFLRPTWPPSPPSPGALVTVLAALLFLFGLVAVRPALALHASDPSTHLSFRRMGGRTPPRARRKFLWYFFFGSR